MSFNGKGLRAAMGVRKDPEGVSEPGGTWVIRWTAATTVTTRVVPKDGVVDIWDACRAAAKLYRCSVYFTPGDRHGTPERRGDHGRILWTRVDNAGHEIDVTLPENIDDPGSTS